MKAKAAVLIRDKKIQDIIKLEEYQFGGLPVLDERGFALTIKNQKELKEFLAEFEETEEGRNLLYVSMTRAKRNLFLLQGSFADAPLYPEIKDFVD